MTKFAIIAALFLVLQYLAGRWKGPNGVYVMALLQIGALYLPYFLNNPALSSLLQMETPRLNMAANMLVLVAAVGLGLAFRRKGDR